MSNKKLFNLAIVLFVFCSLVCSSCAKKQTVKKIPINKQKGIASWYGPGFHGRKTANGERYNQMSMTAAHKKLPFNTYVKVINLDNKKSVIVRINDRGPYVSHRIIDLSKAAAKRLDFLKTGVANVLLFYLPEKEAKKEAEKLKGKKI